RRCVHFSAQLSLSGRWSPGFSRRDVAPAEAGTPTTRGRRAGRKSNLQRRYLEALAILARQHLVRFLVVDECLALGLQRQLAAKVILRLVQRQLVLLEVLDQLGERLRRRLVAVECLALRTEGGLLAQAIADVAEVAHRTGEVALQDVGME